MNNHKMKKYELVSDGRTLRGLIIQGCIEEAKYGVYPQIDCTSIGKMKFTFRGTNYELKYMDGSIYPFLYKTTWIN